MRFLIIFYAMGAIPPIVFYGSWLFGGPDSAFLSSVIDAFAFIRPWVPVLDTYSEYLIGWGQHQIIPLITAVYSYDFLFLLIAPWCVAVLSTSFREKKNSFLQQYKVNHRMESWNLIVRILPISILGLIFYSIGYLIPFLDAPNFDRGIFRSYLMEAPILIFLDYAIVCWITNFSKDVVIFSIYLLILLFRNEKGS